jgi:hypothetical protein
MENIFKETELILSKYKKFNNNKTRSNVSGIEKYVQWARDKEFNHIRKIGISCDSLTFGQVKTLFTKKGIETESRFNKKYPDVFQTLMELSLYCTDEDFITTSICLNHNLKCLPHYDGRNVGDSWIVGLGDYSGGELIIYDEDDNKTLIDIKYKPYCFNGAKIKHSTNEFTGTRYSVIFFQCSK